jgi:hypothetical protein
MGSVTNIEEFLFPNNGKIVIDSEGTHTSLIVDRDLDPIDVVFHNDNGVVLKTSHTSCIDLSVENLYALIALIEESEKIYRISALNIARGSKRM